MTSTVAPQVEPPSLRLADAVEADLAAGANVATRRAAGLRGAVSAVARVSARRQRPGLQPEGESPAVSLAPAVLAAQLDPSVPAQVGVAPSVPAPAPAPPATGAVPLLDASFESGLLGWNTAGVGEVVPRLVTDIVREGERAVAVRLTGELDRSELILGGSGGGSTTGMVEFHEGDEYWYAFSFYIQSMVYGGPGAHNLIMQFKSDGEGSPNFGLQLWDYAGDDGVSGGRGLWSHGAAMGGDRFLAPVSEQEWHDVVIHFRASSQDAGFYEVHLDGQLVDARTGVSMIVPGHIYAYVKNGLYRNGSEIPGTSEIRLDAVRLGETLQSVLP